MMNAGKYNRKIEIKSVTKTIDTAGFPSETESLVLATYADVKTTRGFTMVANDTDFEKAYTRFTIRFPKTPITYEHIIRFNGKKYTIEYINNIDEKNEELELQCKEVMQVGKA